MESLVEAPNWGLLKDLFNEPQLVCTPSLQIAAWVSGDVSKQKEFLRRPHNSSLDPSDREDEDLVLRGVCKEY
jgi:hypothetical protein